MWTWAVVVGLIVLCMVVAALCGASAEMVGDFAGDLVEAIAEAVLGDD